MTPVKRRPLPNASIFSQVVLPDRLSGPPSQLFDPHHLRRALPRIRHYRTRRRRLGNHPSLYPEQPETAIAVLTELPSQAIIDGFKGHIDFYLWKGIPCCRKWPVYRPRAPYPGEALNQGAFAYINRLWSQLPANIQALYRDMAVGTPLTGKDLLVMAYMKGLDYGEE